MPKLDPEKFQRLFGAHPPRAALRPRAIEAVVLGAGILVVIALDLLKYAALEHSRTPHSDPMPHLLHVVHDWTWMLSLTEITILLCLVGALVFFRIKRDGNARAITELQGRLDVIGQIVQDMPMGFTIADARSPDMPVVFTNDAFPEMVGYSRDEIIGRNSRFLQGKGTSEIARRDMAIAISRGESVKVDVLNYRRDGSEVWLEVFLGPIYDRQGELQYYCATHTDITERVHATQRAAALYEVWQRTIDIAVVFDGRLEALEMNATAKDYFKGDTDGAVMAAVRDWLSHELESTLVTGGSLRTTRNLVLPGGETAVLDVVLYRSEVQNGDQEIFLIARDVSSRMRLHEAELEYERQYRDLLESAPDGMLIIDRKGQIIYANRQIAAMTGYPRHSLVGENITKLQAEEAKESHGDYLAAFFEDPAHRVMGEGRPLQLVRSDGRLLPVEIALSPITRGGETQICAAVRDTSERDMLMERERQQERTLLLGQFSGGIAHDFNNLLSIVMGNCDLLLESPGIPEEDKKMLERIARATETGSNLVASLMAFARQEERAPRRVSVDPLLSGFLPMLRQAVGERIEVEASLNVPPDWAVMVDAAQFESAVLNLVLNAADAADREKDASRIDIRTGVSGRRASDGDGAPVVWIEVADNGTGIAEDMRERIFDPFVSTKNKGNHGGLGLSMVRDFAAAAGGSVTLDSEVGEGATFRILLPRLEEEVASPEPPADAAAAGSEAAAGGAGRRILLVEDNDAVRLTTSTMLTALGFEVQPAIDAADALDQLDTGLDVDTVLTDIVMPGERDGIDVARAIIDSQPDVNVVLYTGYSRRVEQGDSMVIASRKVPVLRKPLRVEDLRRIFELAS